MIARQPHSQVESALYAVLAFPFAFQLAPGFDTQPTFALMTAVILCLSGSYRRRLLAEWARYPAQVMAVCALLLGLFASIIANQAYLISFQRIASLLLFLVALMVGLGPATLSTLRRIRVVLWVYSVFTVFYFVLDGAVERALISSRQDMFTGYFATGRGASTLSPEPSFFAALIASLVLLYFLSRPRFLDVRQTTISSSERSVLVISIFLLLATFSGYGALYSLPILLLLGPAWISTACLSGFVFIGFLSESLDFRILKLLSLVWQDGITGVLLDASVGERLRSLNEYLAIFFAAAPYGDAFQSLGGGGLVSILAGVGVFCVPLLFLIIVGLLRMQYSIGIKLFIGLWLLFMSISGPIGVPFVGVIVGNLLRHATGEQYFARRSC